MRGDVRNPYATPPRRVMKLRLTMWDNDILSKDDFMGECTVPLGLYILSLSPSLSLSLSRALSLSLARSLSRSLALSLSLALPL